MTLSSILSSLPGSYTTVAFVTLAFSGMSLRTTEAQVAVDQGPGAEAPEPLLDSPVYAAPTTADRVGRIMAPVMVNGLGPFLFIVDTGATRSAISPSLAARLGLTPSFDRPMTVHGTTGSEAVASVLLEKLQAGDIVMERRHLPVVASRVFSGADGILGVEGFDRMRITVDFSTDRIRISRYRPARMPGNWYRVPVRLRAGRLMVTNARIGRVPVMAVIDTGAERSLGNVALRNALRRQSGAEHNPAESQVIGATGGEQSATTIMSPLISLGETALARVNVTFADLNVFRIWDLADEPALVIGMDVLGTARALFFDYKRSEMLIRIDGPLLMRKDNG